jgi:hypothetical protein
MESIFIQPEKYPIIFACLKLRLPHNHIGPGKGIHGKEYDKDSSRQYGSQFFHFFPPYGLFVV